METTVKERLKSFLKIENIKAVDFCNAINVSSGFISGMRESIQPDKLKSIAVNFPSLNIEWLLTGEGEMLKSKNVNGLEKGALVYDIDATCGTSGRDINFVNEIPIGRIDIPNINPNSQVITATGDSMQPLINSGDRIVIRRIESWSYFNYGQVYLIITEDYRFIKRIRKHENEREMIVLRSENDAYDDIVLPRESIKHLYVVENILSIKNIL